MRTSAVALILTACLALAGLTGLAEEPAAVVNGEEITRQELQAAADLNQIVFGIYQQFPAFAQTLLATEEGEALLERYERDVLDELIGRRLQRQAAEQRGITPDEDEVQDWVDQTLENIKQQNQLTHDELVAALAQQGTSLEEFREEIAVDVREHLVGEALKEEVIADVRVSQEEALEYYNEHPDQFRDEEGELLPFEEVEETIAEELVARAQESAWQEWLTELHEQADITINM